MTNEAERLRRARLGSALRENLKRRKAQGRARNEAEPTEARDVPGGSDSKTKDQGG
jgi:hypothetical protein